MDLAKQFIDVGIFTNRIDEMRTFYAEQIHLPYEELLPVGAGVKQHRFGLQGSVLKINHARDPLPPRKPGGYQRLTISDASIATPSTLRDPDGNDIELVPRGQHGVTQIEIHLGVTDEAAFANFTATHSRRSNSARDVSSLARRSSASRATPMQSAPRNPPRRLRPT
jgi:catechol 2,3-dioxygenase-like lactoylglutathione lyase family enzyme